MVKEVITIMKMNGKGLMDIEVMGLEKKANFTIYNCSTESVGKEIDKIVNDEFVY
ncbi:hypothetical protein HNV12_07580 [Methanococcoides sp. SA1]|nr:hypothetical protein [Methanococcoides sp. SA1]